MTRVPVRVPATLDAIASGDEDWRANFAWPTRPKLTAPVFADLAGLHLDAIAAAGDEDLCDLLRVIRPGMALPALIEFAGCLAAENEADFRLDGPLALDALRGTSVSPPAQDMVLPALVKWWERRLRGLARTATWTPWWRLAGAMVAPEAIAIGHNGLLRAHVKRHGVAVRLGHLDDFFGSLRGTRASAASETRAEAAAELLLAKLLSLPGLPTDSAARISRWLLPPLRAQARMAATLLDGVRSVRHLPNQLLAGTSGGVLGSALSIEILRRGGTVTRFDHGGSTYLMPSGDGLALRELTVCSAFAVASPKAATMPPVTAAAARDATEIIAAAGDPGLDARSARRAAGLGRRRRVMYVSTAFYHLRQVNPPVLPGPVYLDWQIRLLAMLSRLPIDLVCKPHPEGDRGGIQPLAAVATVVEERFETAIDDVDLLIFDYPATTTLSVGLSTDRPVVLIDHGTMRFNDPAAAMIARRCRIVPTSYNDRNLPEVDGEALADAVLSGPDRAEPSDFRALFLDDC